ncbi:9089_t:CDS:2 [Entrophospora sp. SA101]|nr:9089_t:CDS:2 [Entrophospora sp. SA101]
MISAKKELEEILKVVKNSSSPQELKDVYFKTKEIIFEGINTFCEGYQPTDEEIDLTLLACDESSQGYMILGKCLIKEKVRRQNPPTDNPPPTDNGDNDDHNKENEEEIRFESENSQKRADELQKEVDNLRSKNKPVEADKLQKRMEEIKQNIPTKSNPTKSSTGNGKSTLANVLLNKNKNFEEVFKESAGSISETRNIHIEKAEIDLDKDGNEKLEMIIIDTVGIGDTQLTTQGVLYRLAEAASHIGEGLNQIFFVSGGRFTEKEEEAYRLLSSVIFDSKVVNFTTIIRTNFPNFDDETACQKDREAMRKENSRLSNIVNSARIIYVDNPPMAGHPKAIELAKEIREESRQILLTHLGACQTVYKPNNLGNLNQRIGNYMSDKEKLEKEIAEKERLMREQTERMNKQINEVRKKGEREIRELGNSKELEIRRVRENSDREISNLRDENRRTMDRIMRSGSSYIDSAKNRFII